MGEWKHHRLKQARLDAHTVIGIPEDWAFGREEGKNRFWCGREDGPVTLFVHSAVLDGRGTPIQRRAAEVVAFLQELPGPEPNVELRARPGEVCVHGVADHEEDGAPYRTFRWYFFRQVDDDTLAHLRFILSMPVEVSDEPANRELVEIFAEQMQDISTGDPQDDPLWARVLAWRSLPEAERAGFRRDWHKLRIATPFDFIRMLVPENWPVDEWDAGAEMWCLCDEPADEVTLWVDYNAYGMPGPVPDDVLERALDNAVEAARSSGGVFRHRDDRGDGGRVAACMYEGEEKGERLRYWRWEAVKRTEDGVLIVHFSLVTTAVLFDTPDEALLVRIFDEEVPRCEIGEPPARS